MERIAVIDFETTGLSPNSSCRATEIAVVILEQGQIVERGSHAELMALGGRYRELHDTQHEVETDLFINPGEEFASGEAPSAPPP